MVQERLLLAHCYSISYAINSFFRCPLCYPCNNKFGAQVIIITATRLDRNADPAKQTNRGQGDGRPLAGREGTPLNFPLRTAAKGTLQQPWASKQGFSKSRQAGCLRAAA